ncbi:hypothetical protein [Lacrimispora sp. JR3]|uniref:hypothetical protein n=1 Tax=Lacrimispora sinapis TaxID=3111456 RepID=UPI0037487336
MRNSDQLYRNCSFMVTTERISTMLVCVHGKADDHVFGEILSCYMERPVVFKNVGELVLRIDEICNWIGTPHPSTEPRFLSRSMGNQYRDRMEGKNNVPVKAKIRFQDSSQLISRAVKARATLLVTIEYRLYSSLQGRVQGKLTQGKAVPFRSAMELMRMIQEITLS